MKKLFACLTLLLVSMSVVQPAYAVLSLNELGHRSFEKTCTITSAAAATAVHCVADSFVPSSGTVYLTGFIGTVNGGTLWATTATCTIQDTSASPVVLETMAVAALTANAVVGPFTANVTMGSAMKLGTGATLGKGLDIKCNANGTGSNLVVTVFGIIK